MPIIKGIVKGISSGIGLASEAIQDHKDRKNSRARSVSPNPESSSAAAAVAEDHSNSRSLSKKEEAGLHQHDHSDDDSSSDDDEHLDSDNAAWALDHAAAAIDTPPPYDEADSQISPETGDAKPMEAVARDFMQQHPQVQQLTAPVPLPMPVILPQRRPKDKSRGFVRAYAPILGASGIDEKTFIDFLNDFDIAAKASPIFTVINVACFAIGFVPNPIVMGVTTAVQFASRTAQEIQGRYRTNNYLNAINAELFMPKGLYCMIMTFKPDHPYDPVLTSNILTQGTDAALMKATSHPDSELRAKLKNIRLTSGVTRGEMSLPESAPLIYPSLDAAASAALSGETTQPLPESQQSGLKASSAFVATYLDRRAQARYVGMNPNSALARAAPPPEKKFASRFSDPNHPANSGTILGLLTGGHFDPKANKRARKAERRARRHGRTLSPDEIFNAKMGRAPRRRQGIIRRVLQKDVLYLIVTNLPSEAEMREIRQELERAKSQGAVAGSHHY